jgi:glycogen operon protein
LIKYLFKLAIRQIPVSRVKIIAISDMGPYGCKLAPSPGWSEWNDRFRTISTFGGNTHGVGELAQRLLGSPTSSIGRPDERRGVNFVTAHDGFTLRDLVSYDVKHNEANGEFNRDGTDDNRSWNCGVEGETDDESVIALRHRQAQNFMATLILSSGVPMITAGDELGHTQQGNNNAYCQDSHISWVHWDTRRPRRPTDLTPNCSSCVPSIRLPADDFRQGNSTDPNGEPRRQRTSRGSVVGMLR